jgi:pectate lyase
MHSDWNRFLSALSRVPRRLSLPAALLVFGVGLGCGSSSSVSMGTGGSAQAGTGGTLNSGGRSGTGGGTIGTGGMQSSGGAIGTGGTVTVAGGRPGGGGSSSGGQVGSGGTGTGGGPGTESMVLGIGGAGGFAGITGTCMPMNYDAAPVGFAMVGGTTNGGGNAAATTVTSVAAFNSAAGGTGAAVIQISGSLSGTFTVGSNKTIIGMCNSRLTGHVEISGSSNVIFRNVKVVGRNCTDNSVCESGADAISVGSGSNHLWFDHCDVSDGSDGNLDITQASDYVTISWSKFYYSGQRPGGHQFSNLIGADDGDTGDTGHLRTTLHHNWWGAGVGERMPRVRFGQVHVFNNLYTAVGDNNCIGLGVTANVRVENNVFIGVSDPIETQFSNAASVVVSTGNLYMAINGSFANKGTAVFSPSYTYMPILWAATAVQPGVMAGAGVH